MVVMPSLLLADNHDHRCTRGTVEHWEHRCHCGATFWERTDTTGPVHTRTGGAVTLDLRCRFGIHRWGRWEQTSTRRELMPGYWQTGQARHCQRCHFADTRWAA